MKVNIENLRQSVVMPTKEDRADWTNGLYLIYEEDMQNRLPAITSKIVYDTSD